MRNQTVKKMSLAGVMAALVFVMTYAFKIPMGYGYIHLGDGAVFLAAMLLGTPGAAAAALGSALSDLLAGFLPYVLPTAAIKGGMALMAARLNRECSWQRALLIFLLAEAVMVAGYFVFDTLLYGGAAAMAALWPNGMQAVAGVALGMMCRGLLPRIKGMIR